MCLRLLVSLSDGVLLSLDNLIASDASIAIDSAKRFLPAIRCRLAACAVPPVEPTLLFTRQPPRARLDESIAALWRFRL